VVESARPTAFTAGPDQTRLPMRLITNVPDDLHGRGIRPAVDARDFGVELITAEPWSGGLIEGRVHARGGRHDPRPIAIKVICAAAWLDVDPGRVGQRRRPFSGFYDARARRVPVWFDKPVFEQEVVIGQLGRANWLPFTIRLTDDALRATEVTFAAVRYEITASRPRKLGHSEASVPILLLPERSDPVVRVETTPLGSWRLLEWRAPEESDVVAGPISISYEPRRDDEMPLPGETRDDEYHRRHGRFATSAKPVA
jgi:hypothetical protein